MSSPDLQHTCSECGAPLDLECERDCGTCVDCQAEAGLGAPEAAHV